jgi:hypothetical protein
VPDYIGKHNALRFKRAENSGKWFLENNDFKDWVDENSYNLLWCPGNGENPFIGSLTVLSWSWKIGNDVLSFVEFLG